MTAIGNMIHNYPIQILPILSASLVQSLVGVNEQNILAIIVVVVIVLLLLLLLLLFSLSYLDVTSIDSESSLE